MTLSGHCQARRSRDDPYSYIQEFSAHFYVPDYNFTKPEFRNLFPRKPRSDKADVGPLVASVYYSIFDHRTTKNLYEIYDGDSDAGADAYCSLLGGPPGSVHDFPPEVRKVSGGKKALRQFSRNVWVHDVNVAKRFEEFRFGPFAVASIIDRVVADEDMFTLTVGTESVKEYQSSLPDLTLVKYRKDEFLISFLRHFFYGGERHRFLAEQDTGI